MMACFILRSVSNNYFNRMEAIVRGQYVEDVEIVTYTLQLHPLEYRPDGKDLFDEISGNGVSIISIVNQEEIMPRDMMVEDPIWSVQDQEEEDKEDKKYEDSANVIMSQFIELTGFYSAEYMEGA